MTEYVWSKNRLNDLINAAGITSKQIADVTGKSVATVNQWRQNRLNPTLQDAAAMADFFAIPLDYMIGRCDLETTKRIEMDYAKHFMELRTNAFELYLKSGKKPNDHDDKIIAAYPYNMLEDIFGEPWLTELNPLQKKGVERAVSMLNKREQECLLLYYKNDLCLDAIAQQRNLTRERIRQIVHKALRKMRHPVYANMIKNGWDEKEAERFLAKREKELAAREKDLNAKQAYLDEFEQKLNSDMEAHHCDPAQFDIKNTQITLDDMQLSARSYNCLLRVECKTLQDILDYKGDFTRIRNLGRKSMEEIRSKVLDLSGIDICSLGRNR